VSIRQIQLAWEAPTGGIRKLVLVAMADYANDEGKRVFPAVKTLARKCGIDETTCRRAMRDLEDDGLIAVAAKAKQHRPTEYRLTLRAGNAPALDQTAPLDESRAGAPHGRAGAAPIQGGRSAPPSVSEPFIDPSTTVAVRSAHTADRNRPQVEMDPYTNSFTNWEAYLPVWEEKWPDVDIRAEIAAAEEYLTRADIAYSGAEVRRPQRYLEKRFANRQREIEREIERQCASRPAAAEIDAVEDADEVPF
jgi:hypothetical protein